MRVQEAKGKCKSYNPNGIEMELRIDIKTIRLKVGLTQYEFAKTLGVSPVTVHFWESHKKEIRPSNIKKVKQFCYVNNMEVIYE